MKSILLFLLIFVLIILVPVILMGLVVSLTSLKFKRRPPGYYLGYFILWGAAFWVVSAILHMGGQVLSGVVFLQSKNSHVLWVFSFEDRPYLFALVALFYLFLSFIGIVFLVRIQRILAKHFRQQQVEQSGSQ